jgi:hypothetical protein
MRVLRLGTSNDDAGSLPEEQRAWKIAERHLAGWAGEAVETTLKRAWPNAQFPSLVERWVDEHEPDLVVLQVNNFWYGHESIPLWFERRLGRAGKSLSSAGLKVGKSAWFADNRWAQMFNRKLLSILPKATHFTVAEVAVCMEGAMRKVLAHEGVVLLVRGNEDWAAMPMATRRFNRRNAARNAAMSGAMRSVCERLRVPYSQRPTLHAGEVRTVNGAGWHNNAEGERLAGEFDGQAMASAWQAPLAGQ